jgi:glycosyltransferase involved in cell wall biosynthesis
MARIESVLMAHNYYQERGGEDLSFEAERRALEFAGITVHTYIDTNYRIDSMSSIRAGLRSIWSLEAQRDIKEILREHRPQVLHVQNSFPLMSPSIYYAAKSEGVPVVQSIRNYRLFCTNALFYRDNEVCEDCMGRRIAWPGILHKCYRGNRAGTAAVAASHAMHRMIGSWHSKVDHFIALSEFCRTKMIEGGLPAERISVKPNFVYPDPGPSDEPREFVLFVGRLSKEKGIETMLKAWEKIHDRIPLVIAGRGPISDLVARYSERYDGITWLGGQTIDNIYKLMGKAAAVIFPSEWYETFGRVVIEAYARATPVIASDLGAISELIDHGETGYLFKPGCKDSMIAAAESIWKDEIHTREMGRAGRAKFEERFTAEQHLRVIDDIYSRVSNGSVL